MIRITIDQSVGDTSSPVANQESSSTYSKLGPSRIVLTYGSSSVDLIEDHDFNKFALR
jgi:hypothetical protein